MRSWKPYIFSENIPQKFLDMLKNKDKEDIVPLQGQHWKSYTEYDKEESKQQKIGNTEQDEYLGRMLRGKKECRKKQRQHLLCYTHGITKEMNCFIACLNYFKQNMKEGTKYFIKYCQIGMDEKSGYAKIS